MALGYAYFYIAAVGWGRVDTEDIYFCYADSRAGYNYEDDPFDIPVRPIIVLPSSVTLETD